jgi:hypothetical protein
MSEVAGVEDLDPFHHKNDGTAQHEPEPDGYS